MLKVFFCLFIVTSVAFQVEANSTSKFEEIIRYIKEEKDFMKITANAIEIKKNAVTKLFRDHKEFLKITGEIDSRSRYLQVLLNLFSLSQRLTKIWPGIISLMKLTTFERTINIPNLPDIIGDLWISGLRGLTSLQDIYNIKTDILASGKMEGVCSHANLTVSDCFDIALYHYSNKGQKNRAVEWLLTALKKSENSHDISKLHILEYLHLAQCFKGDLKNSTETLKMILKQYPSFSPLIELLEHFTTAATDTCRRTKKKYRIKTEELNNYVRAYLLCRLQKRQVPSDKELKCRLVHYNKPHLKIYPFKMEELHLDPPVLMFYDVIYDNEIELMKKTFHSRTRPAMNDYPREENQLQDTQYNIWVQDKDHYLAKKISHRTAQMTNMRLDNSEPVMLASYGLAGEIKLHRDLGEDNYTFRDIKTRADYATAMYYLNEVEDGGNTVFPLMDLAIIPIKGAALLWFNRHPDWEASLESIHGGCPILRGSKWIITKWLHVEGQDFPKCVPGKEKSFKYFYL